jgi:hypothetical protein
MTISFPNELLLEFFSYFPMQSLIAARGVCRSWRHLVPLASIPSARRKLMELYYDVIQSSSFLSTRDKVISAVEPFDREAYVAALEQQLEGTLPAGKCIFGNVNSLENEFTTWTEFRFWLLEWPEKAVFGWSWPAMSFRVMIDLKIARKNRLCHINCSTIDLLQSGYDTGRETDPKVDTIKPRVLKVWDHGNWGATWLVIDSTEPKLYGALLQLDYIFMNLRPPLAMSWVEWLRQKPEFRHRRMSGLPREKNIR